MSNRRGDVFSEAVVGVFMLIVIALLAYFTIAISGVDVLTGRSKIQLSIEFAQVGGLKAHDAVMFRGTKVGAVHDVEVTPSHLIVHADVDPNIVLRRNYRIAVCNLSMLGGNYLMLEEGDGEQIDPVSFTLKGETPSDWMRDLADISRNLKAITQMDELHNIVTNINDVSQKAVAFADKANQVAEKADVFADSANDIIERLNRGEGTIGRLMSADESVYNELKTMIADARSVMGKLNREKMFDDLEAGIAAFRKSAESFDAGDTLTEAKLLVANLNEISARLKNGEGTLGRLMTDTEAYDQLDGLIRDCRQIIDNYRDSTPISTFSSLLTGAL